MKNDIADFVAKTMDNALKSPQYKSLFKLASHDHSDECDCDDEGMAKDKSDDECFEAEFDVAWKDENGKMKTKKVKVKEDSMKDFEKSLKSLVKEMKGEDEEKDDDKAADHKDPSSLYGLSAATAFDVATDSLLTASAALDEVGMDNGSKLSLKLASLVVEAKKSAKEKVKKEMSKQDKELDKTRLKEEKDKETKRAKEMERKEKEKIQKGKDKAKAEAAKEKEKKDKAEKSGKVKFK